LTSFEKKSTMEMEILRKKRKRERYGKY